LAGLFVGDGRASSAAVLRFAPKPNRTGEPPGHWSARSLCLRPGWSDPRGRAPGRDDPHPRPRDDAPPTPVVGGDEADARMAVGSSGSNLGSGALVPNLEAPNSARGPPGVCLWRSGLRRPGCEPRGGHFAPRAWSSRLRAWSCEGRAPELPSPAVGAQSWDRRPLGSEHRRLSSDRRLLSSDLRPSSSNIRPFELGPRTWELEPPTFQLRPPALELGQRTLELGPSTFEVEPLTFQLRPPTFETRSLEPPGSAIRAQAPAVRASSAPANRRPSERPSRAQSPTGSSSDWLH